MPMDELTIRAGTAEKQYASDLWRYREVFLLLAWRDILVRYKQTVFGIAWAILRPLVTMVAFTFVFNRLAKMPGPEEIPYFVVVLVGTVAWQLFSSSMTLSSQSLVSNANMISKIYFPRILIPLSGLAPALVDFACSLVVLSSILMLTRIVPSWQVLFLPLFALLGLCAAVGCGLWLGALMVRYRDFREVTPFLVQFGLFISPVGYVSDVVSPEIRILYSVNPAVGMIDGFRWCLFGGECSAFLPGWCMSGAVAVLLLVLGIRYFRKTERTFADVI
ncbi:MAG: ABC transporter permease [bacterium]|nr:ABC transporter permease [bacterium]